MRAQKLEIDGVGIQVEDHGGVGTPVLFIHHGGSNLRMWDRVLPYFIDDFRCIVLDLRGHGRSDAPQSGYHIDDMARDIDGVMKALGLERAHIVGSSIGAEVGLSLAANHPDRVQSLVAEGALSSEYGPFSVREAPSFEDDPEMQQKLADRHDQPEKSFPTAEAMVEHASAFYKQCDFWNDTVKASLEYGVTQLEDGSFVNAWRKHASDAYTHHYFTLQFESYYERITCPILMLPDEDDAKDETQRDIMGRLSALASNCEIAEVPGAMHAFGWLLNPEPMARAAVEFIHQQSAD